MNLRVGSVNVCSYRPLPGPELVSALRNAKAVTVMERMDDPVAPSNPLMRDLKSCFVDAMMGLNAYREAGATVDRIPRMLQSSAGLGSRDIRPGHLIALAQNMQRAIEGKTHKEFATVGIKHE